MNTSLQKLPKPNPFITMGLCSLLVAGVVTAGLFDSPQAIDFQVKTGPAALSDGVDESYANSIASGFIAEHIEISSGLDSSDFSDYSAELARTLSKLTPAQRSEVFRETAAYEEDIFASE